MPRHATKVESVSALQALPSCPSVRHEANRAHVIWLRIGAALRFICALQLNPLRGLTGMRTR
eukprot:15476613-Alexandrium_andersonii.AAC.1